MSTTDGIPVGAPRSQPTPRELDQLAADMNVPVEALAAAVRAVGRDPARIEDYLTGGASATQQDG